MKRKVKDVLKILMGKKFKIETVKCRAEIEKDKVDFFEQANFNVDDVVIRTLSEELGKEILKGRLAEITKNYTDNGSIIYEASIDILKRNEEDWFKDWKKD